MSYQIKDIFGEVLHEYGATARECAENAAARGTSLCRASLEWANLEGASLYRANLNRANLNGADLNGASLEGASLYRASLDGANLNGANLYRASLEWANIYRATLPDFQIPQDGSLTVWGKKGGKIVKMLVPEEAKRTACLINRKCRAEFVRTLWIEGGECVVVKNDDGETRYAVGEITRPHDYGDDIRTDCAPGIHFFLTREEAERW